MTSSVDVLIIGGGPAGLACAGGLARQLHTAIVFSHGKFRDERAQVLQNVAGWGQEAPADFREKTRNDILVRHGDTVQFRDVEIRGVKRLVDGRFEALDAHGGKYHGRRVLLTSGVKDQMLSIPGYEELWGRGIFHCLFCQGYEEKGAVSAGILATGLLANSTFAPVFARMAGRLADTINVYTNGEGESLTKALRPLLKDRNKYRFIDAKIEKFQKDPDEEGEAGVIVKLEDGREIDEAFIAHAPYVKLNGKFARQLGVRVTLEGHIDAQPPFYNTNVPGVFAAGDCAALVKTVPQAIATGSCAAAGLAHSLQAEDNDSV